MRRLGAEVGLEKPQYRSEDRHAGQAELAAFQFQPLGKILFQQRVEDNPWRFLDLGQDAINALLGGPSLSTDNAHYMDLQGNRNGQFDVGDLQAFLRARRGQP